MASWRALPNPPTGASRRPRRACFSTGGTHQFPGVRPFFCQVEAVETLIWLTEVARKQARYRAFWEHIQGANADANPELLRIAMKMATGAGKTTVMAMLIAWQTVNAVPLASDATFSRGFLIVTPGITIKDRLRVLLPERPRKLLPHPRTVPADMIGDIGKAKIVITNYPRLQAPRGASKSPRSAGRCCRAAAKRRSRSKPKARCSQRACGELMALKNVVVINDEAHHCYRERPTDEAEETLDRRGQRGGQEEQRGRAALDHRHRGAEAQGRRARGLRPVRHAVLPARLGYAEGTLFPGRSAIFR